MGDNSSARTPGIFLREKLAEENAEEKHVEKSYVEKSYAEKKESVEPKEKKAYPKYNFANRRQVKSCRSLMHAYPIIWVLPVLGYGCYGNIMFGRVTYTRRRCKARVLSV